MSVSSRTGLSLSESAHRHGHAPQPKPGTPALAPARPWTCKRCDRDVRPGQTMCEGCLELQAEWAEDARREIDLVDEPDRDLRESDRNLRW